MKNTLRALLKFLIPAAKPFEVWYTYTNELLCHFKATWIFLKYLLYRVSKLKIMSSFFQMVLKTLKMIVIVFQPFLLPLG